MATVINNPPSQGEGRSAGLWVAVIIVLLAIVFFVAFGRNFNFGGTRDSGTQINVPDKINVDVNKNQ